MSSIARPLTRVPSAALVAAVGLALVASTGAWLWARAGSDAGLGAAQDARVDAAQAQADAAQAQAAVERLTDEVARLEKQVEALKANEAKGLAQIDRVKESLWEALGRLRVSTNEAAAGSEIAQANVQAALDEAASAARALSVLEDRFEYHLRSDHGGG